MLARELDQTERTTDSEFGPMFLHSVLLAEVESIVKALRATGRADPALVDFLRGHVQRYLVALNVVRGELAGLPEAETARSLLDAIDALAGLAPSGFQPSPDSEVVRRFLDVEDAELLALHLLQSTEETEALRSQIAGLRQTAGSALEASRGDDARIQKLLQERTTLLKQVSAVEEQARLLQRRLAESESRLVALEERGRESAEERRSTEGLLGGALDEAHRRSTELETRVAGDEAEVARLRDELASSGRMLSYLTEELAESAKNTPFAGEPTRDETLSCDPAEPADRAPLQRKIMELELRVEELQTANRLIETDAATVRKRSDQILSESSEMRKRLSGLQTMLPKMVEERALRAGAEERRKLSERISQLGARDAVLKSLESTHLVLKTVSGVVAVPRDVARNLHLAPGARLDVRIEGGTVHFAKL